ncbi:MAG: glycosyltransferase family 2 protein [Gaiellaceae bacterium]
MDREGQSAVPHVAIVILAFNGREDTLRCLESVDALDWDDLSTIVVDNGSSDGVVEAVRDRFPHVQVICSEHNLGFAGGNNLGLRAAHDAGADYFLVLNNDTVVDPATVRELVAEAERRPDAGALCPLIYYMDPPGRIWYAGARFDPRKAHNGRHTGYREADEGQYDGVRETGRATGAAMMVPRATIDEVGYLDERLFLTVEDVEWSLRIRNAGFHILVVPDARVWHRVSVAAGGEHSPAIAYYAVRNTLAVSNWHAPLTGLAALARDVRICLVALVHVRRAPHPLRNIRSVIEGWRDYRAGRLGERGAGAIAAPERQPALAAQGTADAA